MGPPLLGSMRAAQVQPCLDDRAADADRVFEVVLGDGVVAVRVAFSAGAQERRPALLQHHLGLGGAQRGADQADSNARDLVVAQAVVENECVGRQRQREAEPDVAVRVAVPRLGEQPMKYVGRLVAAAGCGVLRARWGTGRSDPAGTASSAAAGRCPPWRCIPGRRRSRSAAYDAMCGGSRPAQRGLRGPRTTCRFRIRARG